MSPTSPGRDESMSPGMYPLSDLVQIAHEKSPEESLPKTKTDMFAVSTACIATCLIVVVFYVTLTSIQKKRAKSRYLCETEDCVRHAALLTGKIDWKLDPCDDFEAFRLFRLEQEGRSNGAPWSSRAMDDLRFAWYDRLESVLTQGALQLPAGRKPLSMYRMCRRYYPSNASQMALFRSFIESNGLRWPEPPDELRDPLQLAVALSYLWESPLLDHRQA
ncbi:hypothetical protein MRX96_022598 [Rhipicephalus microplus]